MGISISFRSVPLVSQDLSVAGKQKGLTGERSGLYVEAVRIIREMLEATNGQYPRFCLFENVPGLLSSNKGEDFIAAMDMLQELRFIPDPNIIDAQYHGVPQRRKRVYIVWTNVDYLLSKRTPTSEIITLQLLTELLQSNLADLLRASGNAPKELASLPRRLTADGVRKRIRLFSLQKEECLKMLRQNLDAISTRYQTERGNLESPPGEKEIDLFTLIGMDTKSKNSTVQLPDGYIAGLLNKSLEDRSEMEKSSITSTWTSETIAQKTSTYFQALAHMSDVITVLMDFLARTNRDSLTRCEWVLSFLTEMKVFISAGKRNEKSAGYMGRDDNVWLCERSVSACRDYVERNFGFECPPQVQLVPKGLHRDFKEGTKAWQRATAYVEGSPAGDDPDHRDDHGGD